MDFPTMEASGPNKTKEGVEVKPGQIWRDLDKRMSGRTVRVNAVGNGFAHVADGRRLSRISIKRMHRYSTGFELMEASETAQPAKTTRHFDVLNSLTDGQINLKYAKALGWKLADGQWWHDEFGDGPPALDYCRVIGRENVIYLLQ